MNQLFICSAIIFCFLVFGHLAWIKARANSSNNGKGKKVPEAAGSWPIIGHLHLLAGSQVHHKLLGSMADKFGPIFTLKLGVHPVLIVSNSAMAKECLTTNDRVFASRPRSMASELMGYNCGMIGFAPYGPYWREIRKIIVLELLSQKRLEMISHIRVSEVKSSILDMYTTCKINEGSSEMTKVDLKDWFGNLMMNIVGRVIFGVCFSRGQQNDDEYKKTIRRFFELTGAFVPSDAIPGLRWLDFGGYEKIMKKTAIEMDAVINGWLEEHKKMLSFKQQVDESTDQGFMGMLLSRLEEAKEDLYGFSTDVVVKSTCMALLLAATDTTSATLTWALALLVNNPLVLQKSQKELEKYVGKDRFVEESDLKNLVYLQAIIKETMRLYPAAPLSVPHVSTDDCIVGGYTIPKGTRLLVNLWKIHHDPEVWTDPFEFQPERFLTSNKEIDVKGKHFELIPFSSGRRICPGITFSLEAMQLILANMIHGFEFQNPSNDQIDMTESPGLANVKASSLELLVSPRLPPHVYRVSI
uniref:cytochrome P450 CYP82D47-like isoform X2 n=1 Tax=Erigeron canadensis TaxID=72917 RepID=UPI001CB89F9F|nr:cytochrome P450 CYP82D47-like isoform X2 [Erigeron canadensis]